MTTYRGVDLEKHAKLWVHVETYHILDSDKLNQYLDADKHFQKIFNRYIKNQKNKQNALIALFNISFYISFYLVYILNKG